jgi:hypothetical protein
MVHGFLGANFEFANPERHEPGNAIHATQSDHHDGIFGAGTRITYWSTSAASNSTYSGKIARVAMS